MLGKIYITNFFHITVNALYKYLLLSYRLKDNYEIRNLREILNDIRANVNLLQGQFEDSR